MSPRWRVPILLAVILVLGGIALPPVIENHVEPGFCSADCPVQHAGHGVGVATRVQALGASEAPVFTASLVFSGDSPIARLASPDAPRAPPSA